MGRQVNIQVKDDIEVFDPDLTMSHLQDNSESPINSRHTNLESK